MCARLLLAGIPFCCKVTGAFIENDKGKKVKLWNIKCDNGEEEDVTIRQLMAHQKLYGKHKQYNMVVQTRTVKKKPPPLCWNRSINYIKVELCKR